MQSRARTRSDFVTAWVTGWPLFVVVAVDNVSLMRLSFYKIDCMSSMTTRSFKRDVRVQFRETGRAARVQAQRRRAPTDANARRTAPGTVADPRDQRLPSK
jgi:hypothetical protein